MDVRLLGQVQAFHEGRPVPLGAPKERALLAILALHAPATVPMDRLIEGLWGEDPPATAVKLVQLYVSHLRRALGPDAAAIVTHKHGYALAIAPEAVDARRFEELVHGAARDGTDAREALGMWNGVPLEDVIDEPFAAAETRRLEALRLQAAELAVEGDLADGRCEDALLELEELVRRHPLHEHLHAQRMRALYRCGRQAEALEAYAHARRVLDDEVGLEPGAELRDLQQAILAQDPSLDAPRRAPPVALPVAGRNWRLVLGVILVLAGGAVVALLTHNDDAGGRRLGEDVVGRIDSEDGRVARPYAIGSDPRALVAGAGSVWATSGRDGTVSRIDLRHRVTVRIDAGVDVGAAAYDDGSLWVGRGNGTISRIDARANKAIQVIDVGSSPDGIAARAGVLWVTTLADGRLTRIDLRSNKWRRTPIGASAGAVVAGRGAVWVARPYSGTVVRVEPRSGRVVQSVGVGRGPSALALSPGWLWVANRDDGTLSRVDTAHDHVTQLVSVGGEPTALAVDGGTVWAALGPQRQIVAVSARTGRVRARYTTAGSPAGLTVLGGHVWAAAGASPAAHRGGTLRMNARFLDLDPAKGGYDPNSYRVLTIVYDGLLSYRRTGGSAGFTLVGDLATNVPEPTDDGRTYVFTLRPGLRFSDGAPVRASDFRRSLERTFRIGRQVPPLYDAIRGVPRCNAHPADCDLRDGIVTDDAARTVTLRLTRPDPALPYALDMPLAAVVRVAPGGRFPLGTGPYRIVRSDERSALLVRNRAFREWSAIATPDGLVDRIEVTTNERSGAPAEAVARGHLDLVPLVVPEDAGFLARYAPLVRSAPFAFTDFAFMDTQRPPFDRRAARLALSYAIDRGLLARRTGGEQVATPTCQLLPVGFPGYRPVCPRAVSSGQSGAWGAPDVEAARRLVRASGTGGSTVRVWAGSRTAPYATHVAAVLRTLGYRPRLRRFATDEAYYEAINGGARPQVGFDGWIADDPRPQSFIEPIVSCGARELNAKRSRYCNPALDAAIARAGRREGPPSPVVWSRIERRIAAAAPVIPILNRRTVAIAAPRVGNLVLHPATGALLDRLWVR